MSKRKFVLCVLLLLLLPVIVSFADLSIIVEPNKGWGPAPTSNIKTLCENVALHFQEKLRDEHKVNGQLTIVYSAEGPIAFYQSAFGGGPDEYKVGLTVTDTYWNQYAYQFGHEFCHIMQNHDTISKNNPNIWFHESICMMASIWVLREMGETWAYRPPYPNWVSYRRFLTSYADRNMERPGVQYAGTAAAWLDEWEDYLRDKSNNFTDHLLVTQLSSKFLPIFEENPEAWNAVRQMPASKGKMSEYMQDWYDAVDTEDKSFVEAIAKEMGISVAPVAVVSIDADVNDDGYVDLYDVMIVRSGMQNSVSYHTDINDDGVTNEIDLMIVKAKAFEAIAAASPSKRKIKLTTWGAMKRR